MALFRPYIHKACKTKTFMGPGLAKTFDKEPEKHRRILCATCGGFYPIGEFVWSETGEPVRAQKETA